MLLALLSACNVSQKDNDSSDKKIQVNLDSLKKAVAFEDSLSIRENLERQFFTIDAKQDHVLESEGGAVITIPKGAFRDADGNAVETEVKIELKEAQSLQDQLLSDIIPDAEQKLLASGGMLYINATSKGQQLLIDENTPIYVEVPKQTDNPVMVFEGVRDSTGKLNWSNPRPTEKFLTPVPLSSLDFLPEGFAQAVHEGMPFRNHEVADQALVDSLYYSLRKRHYSLQGALSEILREFSTDKEHYDRHHCPHIRPLSIKAIKGKAFENSLIATREFQARLAVIHKYGRQDVLNLYINNLDKNLWEIDSIAANLAGKNELGIALNDFSKERLTNVPDADLYAEKLRTLYAKRIKELERKQERLEKALQKSLAKKEAIAEKKQKEYKKVLKKRFIHRVEKHGYKIKKLGWTGICEVLEQLPKGKIELIVKNGPTFDRVHSYIINAQINNLWAVKSEDTILFNSGFYEPCRYNCGSEMLWNEGAEMIAIAVGYKDEQPYLAVEKFFAKRENIHYLNLKAISSKQLEKELAWMDKLGKNSFNKISNDLESQAFFHQEKKRKEKMRQEELFFDQLRFIVFEKTCTDGCNGDYEVGKTIYLENCKACHASLLKQTVGTPLYDMPNQDLDWVTRYINDPAGLTASGDPRAIIASNKTPSAMTGFPTLSRCDIKSIAAYIKYEVHNNTSE